MQLDRRTKVRVSWTCPACAAAQGGAVSYPGGPDDYCVGCKRTLDAVERLAAAVTVLLRRTSGAQVALVPPAPSSDETCGVAEAAKLLHTTPDGVSSMHARGQLPPSIGPGRRLLWRRTDLLESRSKRAPSPGRSRR